MMNRKLVQSASSIFLGAMAILCIFVPDEAAKKIISAENEHVVLAVQVLGALLFGWATVNWMSRTVVMGGIYGKGIYMGNLAQFLIGGLALLKWNLRNGFPSAILTGLCIGYLIFLMLYLRIFFTTPK